MSTTTNFLWNDGKVNVVFSLFKKRLILGYGRNNCGGVSVLLTLYPLAGDCSCLSLAFSNSLEHLA